MSIIRTGLIHAMNDLHDQNGHIFLKGVIMSVVFAIILLEELLSGHFW